MTGIQQSPTPAQGNGSAVAGFILSFLIPLLGIIFGVIGLNRAKTAGKGRGLSIAAIVISILNMILGVIVAIAMTNGAA